MSFRELTMINVREVLRRWQAGQGARRIARESGTDRKTVARYIASAQSCGLDPQSEQSRRGGGGGRAARAGASAPRAIVDVEADRSATSAHRSMAARRRAAAAPGARTRATRARRRRRHYTTLRRYVHRELGWREPPVTIRLDDPPLGQEAQIDFGLMGHIVDADGKRRRLWVLIVTLTASRYQSCGRPSRRRSRTCARGSTRRGGSSTACENTGLLESCPG